MKVNPDIEFFRKQVPKVHASRKGSLEPIRVNSKRVHWLKNTHLEREVHVRTQKTDSTKDKAVRVPAVLEPFKKREIAVQATHNMGKNIPLVTVDTKDTKHYKSKLGRDPTKPKSAKVAQVNPKTQPLKIQSETGYKTIDTTSRITNQQKNYYFPLTENFSSTMSSNFSQAIKAIDSTRLSFQQAITKQTAARLKLADKGVGTCVAQPTPKQDGTWSTINQKQVSVQDIKKDKGKVLEKAKGSTIFPWKLPYVSSPNQPKTGYPHHMYTTGVTVTVKLSETTTLNGSKFLEAMLACFRIVDDWAELVPFEYSDRASNPQNKTITSLDVFQDVTFNTTEYLEDPSRKRMSNEYVTRIKVRTSMKMVEILKDRDVKTWLKQEKVYPEINNLGSPHLLNVGFLYKAFPRADSLDLYTERIKKALGNKGPDFHLHIVTIFTEKCKHPGNKNETEYMRSQVIMLRTTSYDVQALHKEMSRLNDTLEFTYHPWKEFMSLSSAQKRTIILGQESFIKEFKILQIKHFTSEVTTTLMHTVDDMNENMHDKDNANANTSVNLQTTSVMEFMMEHYVAGDGLSLFTYIFQPVNGIMEILVSKEHLIEAKDCIEHIWDDIRYYANTATVEKILDPIVTEDSSMRDYIPWKPFTLTKYVEPTPELPSEIQVDHYHAGNSYRANNVSMSSNLTYASAVHNRGGRTTTSVTEQTVNSDSTDSNIEPSELVNLRKQYEDLIKSVEEHTQRIDEFEDQMDIRFEESEQRTKEFVQERMQLQGEILMQKFSTMVRETFTCTMPSASTSTIGRSATSSMMLTPRKRQSAFTSEKHMESIETIDDEL